MTSDWKEKVIERFGEAADMYDSFSDVQEQAAGSLASGLPELSAARILEIGCGTGALTAKLLAKYTDASFDITDISRNMVEQARQKIGERDNVSWRVMDGESLMPEGSYDLIVSNMTFQWFENPAGSLERLRGFLRPGGAIYYSVPGPDSFNEWRSVLDQLGLQSGTLSFTDWPGVFEEEEIARRYESALDFLRRVKAIGAGTARADHQPLSYKDMVHACRWFDEEFKGHVCWQILYGSLA